MLSQETRRTAGHQRRKLVSGVFMFQHLEESPGGAALKDPGMNQAWQQPDFGPLAPGTVRASISL